jgi:hypothetical protein
MERLRKGALPGAAALVVVLLVTRLSRGGPEVEPEDGGSWRPLPRTVTVEVMNAGGTPGAARDAALRLRRAGLDVVWWGNALTELIDTASASVRVYARRGDTTGAGRVAAVLGEVQVLQEPDPDRLVDLTVVLP